MLFTDILICVVTTLNSPLLCIPADVSSSSTVPLSFQHHHSVRGDDSIPIVHVLPSPSSSPYTGVRKTASRSDSGRWSGSCQVLSPALSPLSPAGYLDMKEHRPIRRCSSLTKLSSSGEKSSSRTLGNQYNPDSQGSLDRSLRYAYRKEPRGSSVDLYLPLSSSFLSHSLLQRSPGAVPCYRYNQSRRSPGLDAELSLSSALSSPVKHSSLDMSYSALPEVRLTPGGGQVHSLSLPRQADSAGAQQPDIGSPIQTAIRTQMWLTEQMAYRPTVPHTDKLSTAAGAEGCGADGLPPWQPGHQTELRSNQVRTGEKMSFNLSLVHCL